MINAKAFSRKSIACLVALTGVLAPSVAWSSPRSVGPWDHRSLQLTRSVRQELLEGSGALELARPRKDAPLQPPEMTADQVVGLLEGGKHVYLPIGHMASPEFARALAERVQQGAFSPEKPLTIVGMSNTVSPKIFPRDGRVRVRSPFLGGAYRDVVARGHGDYVHADYSLLPSLYRNRSIPIDVAIHMISPPDKDGYATLGTSVGEGLAAIQAAALRFAEINPNVPPTFGASRIHVSHFDAVFHGTEKLKVLTEEKATEVDQAIADSIAGMIGPGATVQFGIGSIANTVARTLASSGYRYRVWSELLSDGIVDMVRAGAVEGPAVYTFAMGTQRVLDALNGDKRFFALPVDVVNNGQLLARLPLVATNGALEVGLDSSVNAYRRGAEIYSGLGGAHDFTTGARHAPNGRTIIGLPSTYLENGELRSRIIPEIVGGVTTPGQKVNFVVTEHGVAHHLDDEDLTEHELAADLIGIADPAFRPWLQAEFDRRMAARRDAESHRHERFLNKRKEASK